MAHDVFISYSFNDQEDAEYVVNTLSTKYGISCWICTRDIAKGTKYKEKITEAIENSQVVVLIQSKSAVESDQIPKEIGIALEEDKKIIPFRIDSAKLKKELRYDLTGVEYIDATIPTKEQRIYDLAKSISDVIGKPLSTETIPVPNHSVLKSSKITCSEIFAGRDELINDIHMAFEDYTVVFLHGMGGIGKSELARQYWKKHKDIYHSVVFARYDNSLASLIADDKVFDVEGTARKTKEGNIPQSDEEYARDKLAVMKDTVDEHTLIIIDNFDVSIKDDPFFEETVSELNCHILVTTRCEPDKKKHHVIPVGEIDDEALKGLFIQYANPQKTIVEEDDPDFSELFRLTNRHTYTLELVAQFMEENDEIDYISEMIDFLKKHGFGDIEVNGYDSICKLFRFTSLDDNEKYFLRCLAMMPSAGVSQKLFKRWIDFGFSSRSRLVDLSLVKINGETRTISLHPVVREVVINELKPSYENCRSFIDRCAMVGEDCIPKMHALLHHERQSYISCYFSILEYIKEINSATYQLYINVSHMLNSVGQYTDVIALLTRIYEYFCATEGESSDAAMLALTRIAWKHGNCGYYDRALACYSKAANWFINNPNYESREAHASIQACGDFYIRRYNISKNYNDIQIANEYFTQYINYGKIMVEKAKERNDNKTYFIEYQLRFIDRSYVQMYTAIKDYKKAVYYLDKYRQTILDFTGYPDVSSEADMGSWYKRFAEVKIVQEEYNASIEALLKAYDIYCKCFSNKYPPILDIFEQLVYCYSNINDLTKAEEYLSQATELAEVLYTEEHPVMSRLKKYKEDIVV